MKFFTKTLFSGALLFAGVSSGVLNPITPSYADAYGVILPRIISEADKTVVKKTLRVILKDLTKPGDKIIIHDGVANRLIAVAELPNKSVLRHPKVRGKYARAALSKLARFLNHPTTSQNQAQPTEVFRTFSDEVLSLYPNETFRVIYYGGMLEHDDKALATSMLKGHYPGDGHLTVDGYLSPYGVADRPKAYTRTSVHICNSDDRFFNKVHYKAVHRFWGLSLKAQGGHLGTFTDDAGLCLERFKKNSKAVLEFTRDPSQTKPEMLAVKQSPPSLKVQNNTPDKNSASTSAKEMPQAALSRAQGGRFLGTDIPVNTQPAAVLKGIAKIGIRWEKQIDLDLYVSPYRGAKTLSFRNKSSPEGRFDKDWRGAQEDKHAYEFIEFTKQLTLRDMQIAVNFYSGKIRHGARGVLRIWVEGHGIWEKSFIVPANQGNGGDKSTRHWIKIDPADVLGLPRLTRQ
ncbi:MAG: hypothetical protein ACRBBJ_08940 [Rhodomicrobiaceae bacterium]